MSGNRITINYYRDNNGVAKTTTTNAAQQKNENASSHRKASGDNSTLSNGTSTPGQNNTSCKSKGDPINMATGAFFYEDSDFILSESSYDFHLIRRYTSVKEPRSRKSIGWKWTLSVDTSICRDGGTTIVTLPDSKEIEFDYHKGIYKNKRGNHKKYTLIRPEEKFIFEDNEKNQTYIYDKEGRLETVTDRYGNVTRYEYCDYGIEKVILSTGLTLTFSWKDMKVSCIEDNAGRKVEYQYERGILSRVIRCDGTTLIYTYDANQNLTTITDGNGKIYIKNEYDNKARVTA